MLPTCMTYICNPARGTTKKEHNIVSFNEFHIQCSIHFTSFYHHFKRLAGTQTETPSIITLITLSFPCRTNSKASSACSNLNRFVMSLLTSILPLAIRSTAVG